MHGSLLILMVTGAMVVAPESEQAGATIPSPTTTPAVVLPADTTPALYRAGRTALNAGELARAASLFNQIHARHPRSEHAADAYYWEAFARHRLGGEANLRRGLALLEEQATRHPNARTRADARTLEARIRGTLAQAGDTEASARLAREARQDGPDCQDADLRAAALVALARSEPDEAAALATEVLRRRDECSTPLREHAVHLLGRHGTAGTPGVLMEVVRSDPSPRVQEAALWTLARSPGSVDALIELYGAIEERRHREALVHAIQRAGGDRAQAFLRGRALDAGEPVGIREAALHALARTVDAPELIELYGRLDDQRLKQAALFGIVRSDAATAEAFLRERALDPSEAMPVREAALFQLTRTADAAEVARIYRRMTEPRLKEAALYGLVRSPEGDAVEILMEIARTETEPRLREVAVHALGRSEDPRARRFLRELVIRP